MGSPLKIVFVLMVVFGVTGWLGYEKTLFGKYKREASLYPTANPSATREAQKLMLLLKAIQGKLTLAGQHSYLEKPDEYAERVKRLTGEYPAIKGYELGGILNQTAGQLAKERDGVVKSAIEWYKAGGIVTITYHVHMPGECYCWEQVNNGGLPEREFEQIVTPGTEAYKKHLRDLDDVAVYLKKLQAAGVPVLWRPYHEMNGGWFWWGKQQDFAKLWNVMFERFAKVHKLNNLLWVWSPGTPDEWADPFEPYAVPADRVDVLALDIYHGNYGIEDYKRLLKLARGKPIAMGETGELPDPALLANDLRDYSWFMAWGDELLDSSSPKEVERLYDDERILSLSDLVEIRKSSWYKELTKTGRTSPAG